jgi:hypothetical protein
VRQPVALRETTLRDRIGFHARVHNPTCNVEVEQEPPDLLAGGGVDCAGRLVRQQQRRLVDQRAGDRHALPLAAGRPGRVGVTPVPDLQCVDQLAGAAVVAWAPDSLAARFAHVPWVDVLLILTGLPVMAAVVGWLFAGRQPPVISRQPLE